MRPALLHKGFRAVAAHHEMYWLYADDKKTSVRTRLSHGEKEYGQKLLAAMRKQLKLSKAGFDRFMDCPMTGEHYLELLTAQGHVVLAGDRTSPATRADVKRKK